MSIKWDEFDPRRYEDMVSVLLNRLHPNAQRIDGKGGDGGRDVQIACGQDGQFIDAFELKSFTGRMNSSRRKQVTHSLKRAATLGPARWSLVVPIDHTPSEEDWFRQLGEGYSFPTAWLGKTWLDEKMSAFPDIRRYFVEGAKDEVFRLLRELREEQARVTDVHDAVGRIRTLRDRLHEIDPYYRYEIATGTTAAEGRPADVVFSVGFGDVRVDVYPKYSGATKDRPVTVKVEVVVGPDCEVVQNALNYGLAATIPSGMISSVTVDAPSGLGGSFTEGEINLLPISTKLDEPITIALKVMDGDRLLANCPVHLVERTIGLKGSVVTGTDSTGWLQTRLRVDVAARELKAQFWLDPKPAMPAALVPLIRWLKACQPPNCLAICWPDGSETRSDIRTPHSIDQGLGRIVEALAFLQEHSGIYWEMPPSLTAEEEREIVEAATLLKGETVDLTWKSLNLCFDRWGPKLEELVDGRPLQFLIEHGGLLELEGVTIPMGRIRTYIESARLADPGGVRRALESGSVVRVQLVPGDSNKAKRIVVS